MNNNIKIENSSLYGIDSLNTLMLLLGIHGEDELCKLCSVENYNIYYTGPKKRLVEAPYKRLKLIQKKFNNYSFSTNNYTCCSNYHIKKYR